ncbi:MAG TPA: retropepsin-like aspartic protease [Stellaceae bacterium]|nr:retropepsin-like aspartic protease [Stellaceae bacterium]
MNRWLSGAIVMTALVSAPGYAGEPAPVATPSRQHAEFGFGAVAGIPVWHSSIGSSGDGVRLIADPVNGCGTVRLGETTVATLRNAPIVTVLANGAPVTLLLDTGAETTILTPAVAQRIGAQPPRVVFQRQLRGVAGSLQTSEVELRSFTVGAVAIPWRRVRVAPVNVANVFSGPLDGVLGADSLSSFDVDLDLPGHRMIFYEKQTCPDATPFWTQPYARIAAGRSTGDHLFFPVQLDGRRIDAFVDTGSQFTVLSTRAALALGVTEAELAHDRGATVRGAASERLVAHIHRFSQLAIGEEVIRNPETIVTDVRLSDADLVLGIDFLKSRRIWLSYGSQQIFLLRRT